MFCLSQSSLRRTPGQHIMHLVVQGVFGPITSITSFVDPLDPERSRYFALDLDIIPLHINCQSVPASESCTGAKAAKAAT